MHTKEPWGCTDPVFLEMFGKKKEKKKTTEFGFSLREKLATVFMLHFAAEVLIDARFLHMRAYCRCVNVYFVLKSHCKIADQFSHPLDLFISQYAEYLGVWRPTVIPSVATEESSDSWNRRFIYFTRSLRVCVCVCERETEILLKLFVENKFSLPKKSVILFYFLVLEKNQGFFWL